MNERNIDSDKRVSMADVRPMPSYALEPKSEIIPALDLEEREMRLAYNPSEIILMMYEELKAGNRVQSEMISGQEHILNSNQNSAL